MLLACYLHIYEAVQHLRQGVIRHSCRGQRVDTVEMQDQTDGLGKKRNTEPPRHIAKK